MRDDVFEPPTLNGRPLLSIEVVQQWIKEACGRVPLLHEAERLAAEINHYDFLSALWKDTADLKLWRAANPSKLRLARISQALTTLKADLRTEIDTTLEAFPDANGPNLLTMTDLLALVEKLSPAFQKFERRGGGRQKVGWHKIARALGPRVISALESSGLKNAGFGQPTAPAIAVLRSALAHLGVSTSEDAIVDAMRNRTKPGKLGLRNP
jgi:hypothetical protein